MKKIVIAAGAIIGFTALSVYNYRRYIPKPRAVSETGNEVDIRKLPVPSGGNTLYGELMLPKGAEGPLPTIICSHGFNGSYRYFRNSVGMSLAMSGFAVYCFDFYGGSSHSKSGGTMSEMSILSETEQLCDVIRAICGQNFADSEHLFLLGESQGGFVTAMAAARMPEKIRAITQFYPAFCAKDDMLKRYSALDEVPETIRIMGKKVGKRYYAELFDLDAYTEAKKYTGPVLILHGDADRTVDISYGRSAAEGYAGARFAVLPGEDHGFSAKGKQTATKLTYEFFASQCAEREETEEKPMLKIAEKIKNGEKPTLCFFGDSVTDGEFEFTDGYKGSVQHEEWAFRTLLKNRIRDELGKEITVINAGVGGNFSDDGLARIQPDVLDKKPDFCCVMFGTNDVTNSRKGKEALEHYKQNLREIVNKLRGNDIEIVLMTPGMLCDRGVKGFTGFWWFIHKYYESLQKGGKMDAYVDGMRAVAKELNVPLADAYAEWQALKQRGVDTTAMLVNGMNHPTPEAHKIFADKLYELIFGG